MTIWQPCSIDPAVPKFQAIADAIASDVRAGLLRPGDRLPTHRDLAEAMGVNVSTVTRGYKEAAYRGLVCGIVGRGTFVSADAGTEAAFYSATSRSGPSLLEMGLVTPLYDLDPDVGGAWDRISSRRDLAVLLRYGAPDGLAEGREAGAAWAGRYGMRTTADEVLLFSGVQHGLCCCLLSLFRPQDRIAVEQLTYPGMKSLASLAGLRLVPLEMDRKGVIPESLEAACRRETIKGVYLMPSVQNPTTSCLSRARRDALAEVIARHKLILLEDDIYALTLKKRPCPIASRIPDQTVFFAGVSKVLWPGLRICFAVVPRRMRRLLSEAILSTVWMPPPLSTALVAESISSGEADNVISAKRQEAGRRCAAAREILGRVFIGPPTGFFIWLVLPPPWTGRSFEEAALEAGVRVFGADRFAVGGVHPPEAARVSLTGPESMEGVRRGLDILAHLLNGQGPSPRVIL